MMKKINSCLLLLILFIVGCDPRTHSFIINSSDSDVDITLYFDKEMLDTIWHSSQSYIEHIESFYTGYDVEQTAFDTIELIASYKLPSKDTMLVHSALGATEPWFLFSKLRLVRKVDTLIFEGQDQIFKQFKNVGGDDFVFEINGSAFNIE